MEDLNKIQEFFSKPLEEISTDNVAMRQQYILTEPVQIAYTDSFGTGISKAKGVLHQANAGYFIGEEDAYIIILPGGTFYVSEDEEVAMRIWPIRDQSNEFGAALAKTPFAPKYEDWKDFLRKAPVKEADLNDPVAMKMRAAKIKADKLAKMRAANAGDDGNDKFFDAAKLRALKKKRAQIMRDMEQEAEMEGGPVADKYGDMLNKIDKAISMLGEAVNEYDVYMPSQEEVDQFFEKETHLQTHYLNSKPVMGQEGSFNKTEVQPWDEYDYSNWKALVSKALEEYNTGIYYKEDDTADKAKDAAKSGLEKVRDFVKKVMKEEEITIDDATEFKINLKHLLDKHEVKEEEGYSKFLKTDDNPEGKTKGLDTKTMNKILMNVIKDLDELKQLGEGVIEEELCAKGKAYIKKRQAAGEKSSAYLSGRAVKVCKGQMKG
jgi:hypothetical protein